MVIEIRILLFDRVLFSQPRISAVRAQREWREDNALETPYRASRMPRARRLRSRRISRGNSCASFAHCCMALRCLT
jgi:hypothetical protein